MACVAHDVEKGLIHVQVHSIVQAVDIDGIQAGLKCRSVTSLALLKGIFHLFTLGNFDIHTDKNGRVGAVARNRKNGGFHPANRPGTISSHRFKRPDAFSGAQDFLQHLFKSRRLGGGINQLVERFAASLGSTPAVDDFRSSIPVLNPPFRVIPLNRNVRRILQRGAQALFCRFNLIFDQLTRGNLGMNRGPNIVEQAGLSNDPIGLPVGIDHDQVTDAILYQ